MDLFRDPGVYRRGKRFYTENMVPGASVYGEALVSEEGREFRVFDPFHSKLAAYLAKGGSQWPFDHVDRLLYLGAGSGSTVSHISDMLPRAHLYAVERFPRPFGVLLQMARSRPNLYPILADAQSPERYRALPGEVDLIYQDVSQRNQVAILLDNVRTSLDPDGVVLLQLKTRSITQSESPRAVLKTALGELEAGGLVASETVDLAPFSRDHYALVLERAMGKRGARPAHRR